MAKFIKLTNTDESDIFINVEQIQTITKDENDTAIQFEDGDGETEIIAEELRTGYKLHGNVLRHSMVKVAKK